MPIQHPYRAPSAWVPYTKNPVPLKRGTGPCRTDLEGRYLKKTDIPPAITCRPTCWPFANSTM